MTTQSILLLAAFLLVLLALSYPLGKYLAKVADNRAIRGLGWLHKFEGILYRVAGVDAAKEPGWKHYALSLVAFNTLGALFVYALQRVQLWLPLNPQKLPNVGTDSSFNTAISFISNTNWQSYTPEATMSYLTQMLALTGQNFFSAATGIAVVFALIRGFTRKDAGSIGNFWIDMTRSTLYVLLPLSAIFAVFLMSQGVLQNFDGYKDITLVEPVTYTQPKLDAAGQPIKDAQGNPVTETLTAKTQTLAMGPVASQEAIKMLGTNGGGFFNANSAHPFENPTPLSNFFQMIAIFIIPAGLCFAFGEMVGDKRQGWAIIAAMTVIFVVMSSVVLIAEQQANPLISPLGVDQASSALQAGGNMEGKETRFGISASALFAAVTTGASCGAVNSMHDSFMPMGGLVPMVLIQLSEVVFGGVGTGLYTMLIYAILAVFIAGLMIGRTPEYLGKKIQSYEMKMVSIALLVTPLLILAGAAVSVMLDPGKAGISFAGPHGFSQIIYAMSSAANNNGSAFMGLSANTPYFNYLLAFIMWLGRFSVIIPVLAIAASLAAKKRLQVNAGTMPTHGALFVSLLIGTVLLIGVLNYVPALALGPIAEHLQLFTH